MIKLPSRNYFCEEVLIYLPLIWDVPKSFYSTCLFATELSIMSPHQINLFSDMHIFQIAQFYLGTFIDSLHKHKVE